jgi:hypothetical protein
MRPLRRVLRRGLVVGLLLVALAGVLQPQAAEATHACAVDETGHRGWRICETLPARAKFDNRWHLFVVGTDWAIWYAWQVRPGGPWSTWHTLGGEAWHQTVRHPYQYESPFAAADGNSLVVIVEGFPFHDLYCKRYLRGQGWRPWQLCP